MKYLPILLLSLFFVACGGEDRQQDSTVTAADQEAIATEPAENEVQAEGRQLIANSDCVACHKDNERVIGPSYEEVAERYPHTDSTVTFLASKIIQGGAGNWGTVPMTAHPQHSQEEAEKMARYILSLKN